LQVLKELTEKGIGKRDTLAIEKKEKGRTKEGSNADRSDPEELFSFLLGVAYVKNACGGTY